MERCSHSRTWWYRRSLAAACAVAAPAFTTGLNRLIRREQARPHPDRAERPGPPAQVLQTLGGPLYADVLDVRATVCLMDARHLRHPLTLSTRPFRTRSTSPMY